MDKVQKLNSNESSGMLRLVALTRVDVSEEI
jgi:hypothetical protein